MSSQEGFVNQEGFAQKNDASDYFPDVPVFSMDADFAAFRDAVLSLATKENTSISLRINAFEKHKAAIDKAVEKKDLTCLHAFLPHFFSAAANADNLLIFLLRKWRAAWDTLLKGETKCLPPKILLQRRIHYVTQARLFVNNRVARSLFPLSNLSLGLLSNISSLLLPPPPPPLPPTQPELEPEPTSLKRGREEDDNDDDVIWCMTIQKVKVEDEQ